MLTFYLVLVIILFILAISDLVVGVSNDAVNFLNSAVGSKAASFKVIIAVAALGVLFGATFSSGMMEVARKGIFHPEYFYFSEIIILFLAVMVTDVILLDTFNTFGMPTSTTVSIVFELLGAAVALSVIKVYSDPNALSIYEYINSGKALAIISGIFLSVIIAFTFGVVVQYFNRLLFSFDYEKKMKRFGALWGGIGITAITYFMLIKGAKGASFMSDTVVEMINSRTALILLFSLAGWTIILYLLNRTLKLDIPKTIVLVGTFALAMAFAGNDLVNFIGVPLAGYNSYLIFAENAGTGADQMLMDGLAGKVPTPTYMLLLAGLIMVLTLYTSKKARSVVQTSLDLGRQDEGYERFSSFLLSRRIVRNFAATATYLNERMPNSWKILVNRQFDETPFTRKQVHLGKNAPSFDMIRAAVTLVVASILIAIGTSLKLPLSTTYVTFMVFMGTSLADGAWGRESAVYRVSGVLSVIGGWFFTAFSAFTAAFLLALLFYYGGIYAIAAMLLLAGYMAYKAHRFHAKKLEAQAALDESLSQGVLSKARVIDLCATQLKKYLTEYGSLIEQAIEAFAFEDLGNLNRIHNLYKPVYSSIQKLKNHSSRTLERIPEHELEAGHLYILVIDYVEEMGRSTMSIIKTTLEHIDNNHKPLLPEQIDELEAIHKQIQVSYGLIQNTFSNLDREAAEAVIRNMRPTVKMMRETRKNQIKRIKKNEVGTRNSILFFNLLGDFRNLLLFSQRITTVFDELILNPVETSDYKPPSGDLPEDQVDIDEPDPEDNA